MKIPHLRTPQKGKGESQNTRKGKTGSKQISHSMKNSQNIFIFLILFLDVCLGEWPAMSFLCTIFIFMSVLIFFQKEKIEMAIKKILLLEMSKKRRRQTTHGN